MLTIYSVENTISLTSLYSAFLKTIHVIQFPTRYEALINIFQPNWRFILALNINRLDDGRISLLPTERRVALP